MFYFSPPDSSDGLKRTNEAAIHCGYQRRTREIADWARKKSRRYIRREELLSYLAGKPPPPVHLNKVQHHISVPKPDIQHGNSTTFLVGHQHQPQSDSELHTFKEALARRPR